MTDSPSDVVAARVQKLRRDRGWSAQRLAQECAALGASHLTPSVIANIETGRKDPSGKRRRDVTVDELLVFACALNAPVPALLVPFTSAAVRVTPDRSVSPGSALQWLLADSPLPAEAGMTQDGETWSRHDAPIQRYRKLWELQAEISDYWALIDKRVKEELAQGPDTGRTAEIIRLRDSLARVLRDVVAHLVAMHSQGMALPELPPRLDKELEQHGYQDMLRALTQVGDEVDQ